MAIRSGRRSIVLEVSKFSKSEFIGSSFCGFQFFPICKGSLSVIILACFCYFSCFGSSRCNICSGSIVYSYDSPVHYWSAPVASPPHLLPDQMSAGASSFLPFVVSQFRIAIKQYYYFSLPCATSETWFLLLIYISRFHSPSKLLCLGCLESSFVSVSFHSKAYQIVCLKFVAWCCSFCRSSRETLI